jgi:hypothetical protein
METSELQEAFIGLGTTITEDDPPRAAIMAQRGGQTTLWLIAVEIADVDELPSLLAHALDPNRVGMTQSVDRNACGKI